MADKVTRRQFLERATAIGVGAWAAGTGAALLVKRFPAAQAAAAGPRIIIARDPAVVSGAEVNAARADHLLSGAVAKFVGASKANDAWRHLFKPQDVVAIKVSCIAGAGMSTRPELVACIVNGLRGAGVPDDNIIIYERTDRELQRAGFTLNRGAGVKCYGHEKDVNPNEMTAGKFRGHICRILADQATALINVPVLKDHNGTGVTCSMKNHYGTINNPGAQHPNRGDPYCGDLNTHPIIRGKTRLIVVDALWALADGGPGYNPAAKWPACSLIVGRDTVAVDRVGWDTIEKRRKATGVSSLAEAFREPTYIHSAALAGLGVDDLGKMQIIETG